MTRNLPPLVGGMEKLLHNLAIGIAQYSDLTVVGPYGCSKHLPKNIKTIEAPKSLAPFLLISTWRAIRELRKGRCDLLIGGSGLIALTLYILNKLFRNRTLIYLHGLDLVVDNWIYQTIFMRCIRSMDTVVVNSQNTKNLALSRRVKEEKITIIHPGTVIPSTPDQTTLNSLKRKYDISFEHIMIFVGRFTRRKGLSTFIERCLPQILSEMSSTGLIVVGNPPGDSLNRMGEEGKVAESVSANAYHQQIIFLGQVTEEEFTHCYALADVQIFPLVHVEGDVEGFGMVAIEAAALGTPTVAFDVGGVADAVSSKNGLLVAPSNYEQFSSSVVEVLREKKPDRHSCIEHAKSFNWDIVNDQFQKTVLDTASG
ncbi:MAG: glycosyltransferase family 4 protein, partial [Pseudomonadota bacterium]